MVVEWLYRAFGCALIKRTGNRYTVLAGCQIHSQSDLTMSDSHTHQGTNLAGNAAGEYSTGDPVAAGKPRKQKSISMHENVGPWCDCCTCEAEPYWLEVAEELGIDLGSDYEDDKVGD